MWQQAYSCCLKILKHEVFLIFISLYNFQNYYSKRENENWFIMKNILNSPNLNKNLHFFNYIKFQKAWKTQKPLLSLLKCKTQF